MRTQTRYFAVLAVLFMAMLAVVVSSNAGVTPAPQRFETLSAQQTRSNLTGGVDTLTAYHDTDSGVEFVCRSIEAQRREVEERTHISVTAPNNIALATAQTAAVSCFTTGRVWGRKAPTN